MKCVVLDRGSCVVIDKLSDERVRGAVHGAMTRQVTYHSTLGEARAVGNAMAELTGRICYEFTISDYGVETKQLEAELECALKEARAAGERLAKHTIKDYTYYRRYMDEVLFEDQST